MPPLPARRKPDARQEEDSGDSLLAALPDIDLSAQAVAPASVVTGDAPINVYVRLARQIRRCWLGPTDPKLPDHGFRAEAEPGEAGTAKIDVYKKAPNRKYGPLAFGVKISPEGAGALVESRHPRLDEQLADALRGDVARWTEGGTECGPQGRKSA